MGPPSDSGPPSRVDDFAACGAASYSDVSNLFAARFWFGCEADDPGAAWAIRRPYGLNAMFGSDIGHFDVPHMTSVLPAAWSLRDRGLLSDDEFRDYVFVNAVRLHGGMNPRFFVGTSIEAAASEILSPPSP